jgi:hypothetical protein
MFPYSFSVEESFFGWMYAACVFLEECVETRVSVGLVEQDVFSNLGVEYAG